jgi:hypothetical protein
VVGSADPVNAAGVFRQFSAAWQRCRKGLDVRDRNVDAKTALREQLGPDLAVLDLLTEQESAELQVLIDDARATQRKALDASISEVLGRLPRLARGPARKIMFG